MPATALSATLNLSNPHAGMASVSGGVPDAGDAGNGNSFANTGSQLLVVDNVAGSARTITFKTAAGVDMTAQNVAANAMQVFGPFAVAEFGSTVIYTPSHADLNARVFDMSAGRRNLITR